MKRINEYDQQQQQQQQNFELDYDRWREATSKPERAKSQKYT